MTSIVKRPPLESIEDPAVRESLQWMYEYLVSQPVLQGNFELFDLEFTQAETNLKIPHELGFVPKDILHLSTSNGQTVTFNYDEFTSRTFDFTVSGACRVRFLGGSYGL